MSWSNANRIIALCITLVALIRCDGGGLGGESDIAIPDAGATPLRIALNGGTELDCTASITLAQSAQSSAHATVELQVVAHSSEFAGVPRILFTETGMHQLLGSGVVGPDGWANSPALLSPPWNALESVTFDAEQREMRFSFGPSDNTASDVVSVWGEWPAPVCYPTPSARDAQTPDTGFATEACGSWLEQSGLGVLME